MLKDELSSLNAKQKKYIQYLVAGIKKDVALKLANIPSATYKWWSHDNEQFHSLVERVEELKDNYFDEAFQMLRQNNKVMALFLEQELLVKIKEEIENGEYNLVKTPLAKEVYNKALEESKGITLPSANWMQFVQTQNVIAPPRTPLQIEEINAIEVGDVINEDL
jgi:hypothetical protein